MTNLLSRVGAPRNALNKIGHIVDTCDICRSMSRPAPKTVATSRLATSFNAIVQHDIMFAEPYPKTVEQREKDEELRQRNVE